MAGRYNGSCWVNMSATADSIRERLQRGDTFRRDEIVAFMKVEDDLDLWSAAYEVLAKGYHKIQPEAGMEMTCSSASRIA